MYDHQIRHKSNPFTLAFYPVSLREVLILVFACSELIRFVCFCFNIDCFIFNCIVVVIICKFFVDVSAYCLYGVVAGICAIEIPLRNKPTSMKYQINFY